MMRITVAAIAFGIFCQAASGPATPDFYLHDGDTKVFYGDSITSRLLYSIYTEACVSTHFPKLHVRFIHSGWDGDRDRGGTGGPIDQRLDRDVLALCPTVVTILLGMNDGEYKTFNTRLFEKSAHGDHHIIEHIKKETAECSCHRTRGAGLRVAAHRSAEVTPL